MKRLIFILVLLNLEVLCAKSPFTLEGIQSVNVLLKNNSHIIDKKTEEKIKNELTEKLKQAGISTPSHSVSTFGVMIEGEKKDKSYFVSIRIMIGEEVIAKRKNPVETFAITFSMDDFIVTENPNNDVYESVIEFLLGEFLEQYKEENAV